ncbi:hypothetical protein [Nocardioides sp.]|uniref:hypothetical protein n=1 Tax=Nocardioides sp. TaxID=35761 RepID=UPI00378318CF
MAISGLNHLRSVVLLLELDEATAITSVGLRNLRDLHHVSEEAAAVLTLLSIGSEKMLKMALGLAELDDGHPWPATAQMKRWGHNIGELDGLARARYERQIDRSTAPGYIRELLDQCADDRTLRALLEILTAWGLQARFHRLDELAGSPQPEESPQALWDEMETDVLSDAPELLRRLGDPAAYDETRAKVNELIGDSFRRWWNLHARAWMTGVLGPEVQGHGGTLLRAIKA